MTQAQATHCLNPLHSDAVTEATVVVGNRIMVFTPGGDVAGAYLIRSVPFNGLGGTRYILAQVDDRPSGSVATSDLGLRPNRHGEWTHYALLDTA